MAFWLLVKDSVRSWLPFVQFMLIGKHIKLKARALGLESIGGERHPVLIPVGAFLEFTSEPTYEQGLANVLWDNREGAIFLSSISRDERESLELDSCRW